MIESVLASLEDGINLMLAGLFEFAFDDAMMLQALELHADPLPSLLALVFTG
jgi:hypothetical protein